MNNKAAEIITANCEETIQANPHDLSPLKNKTIYIAGGTGFVGTWVASLIQYLNKTLDFNTQLYLLARQPEKIKHYANHLMNDENIKFIEDDVRRIYELPTETNYVIDAACTPNSQIHSVDPLETVSTITDGTKNLLMAANRCSALEKFIYLSSASVYGTQPWDLKQIPETFNESAPRSDSMLSAYAEAKRFAETLCTIFRSQYRMPIVITRPFSFIGPFQTLESPWAISNFINEALHGEEIKILGDGRTIRSYLYGSDVAFWLLVMLIYGETGEIYNIGNNDEIDIKTLAEMIVTNTKRKTNVLLTNPVNNQLPTTRLVPSLKKLKHDLKLNTSVNLEDAIKYTMLWHEDTA